MGKIVINAMIMSMIIERIIENVFSPVDVSLPARSFRAKMNMKRDPNNRRFR